MLRPQIPLLVDISKCISRCCSGDISRCISRCIQEYISKGISRCNSEGISGSISEDWMAGKNLGKSDEFEPLGPLSGPIAPDSDLGRFQSEVERWGHRRGHGNIHISLDVRRVRS